MHHSNTICYVCYETLLKEWSGLFSTTCWSLTRANIWVHGRLFRDRQNAASMAQIGGNWESNTFMEAPPLLSKQGNNTIS